MTSIVTTTEASETKNPQSTVEYKPRIDILENEDELVLYADLPGVEPQDLDIQYENQELTIHGTPAARQESGGFVHREFGVGDFRRAFTLSESLDVDRISAELNNGVLKLRLPKSEAIKPKRIEVKAG